MCEPRLAILTGSANRRLVENMLPITGYADRLSLQPGETINFKVSCISGSTFEARLVRIRCGDPNPDGPGVREEPLAGGFQGRYPARFQQVNLGSYARIADAHVLHDPGSFTLVATIWPTTPEKPRQGILCKQDDETGAGIALLLNGEKGISAILGDGDHKAIEVSVGKRLRARQWYRVWVAYDHNAGELRVGQKRLESEPLADDSGAIAVSMPLRPQLANDKPLIVAAIGGDPVQGHYNGKLEDPMWVRGALDDHLVAEVKDTRLIPASVIGRWDFSIDMPGTRIIDTGPYRLHGELVNLPTRAMTGSRWTGEEMCWRHASDQYAAIHFHDDDIYDCNWETDFSFTVPLDVRSGVYAARIRSGEHEDMIPFFVRPRRGIPGAQIGVLVPTFTYIIYANHARGNTDDVYRERAAAWGGQPWTPDDHPDYGLSTYNFHSDGSGICHSSRLRPIITMRSKFLSIPELPGSGLRHFPADTHLYDWLEQKGHEFDVVTDEDLHEEGIDLIAPYKVLMTTSHPEYQSKETLDALTQYTRTGGRLMYMGGNGFYWRVGVHRDCKGAIEIRRGEGGLRAWASEPGEYWNAFDGAYGGLWRRNGRPPQKLAGIGFTAQGKFESSHYRRKPGAGDPRAAWIFEGVSDEILGNFGLCGGGAAGYELDRLDYRLGSPENVILLASLENPPASFVLVPEEHLTHIATWAGEPLPNLLRADMVYFETANGGAVFSTGSITFCGSLSYNRYDNNISRIVENVLRRFKS
jgi:N,N-dimethylformamidase